MMTLGDLSIQLFLTIVCILHIIGAAVAVRFLFRWLKLGFAAPKLTEIILATLVVLEAETIAAQLLEHIR